jgi:hypothetical protein
MMRNGTNTSFDALKQIDAGVPNIGYVEAGKGDGPAVLLLHGWPYDIYSYVDVAPLLAQAGHHGRHRTQSASRSAPGLCPGGRRCRRVLDVDIM